MKNQSRDLVNDLTTLSQVLEIPGGVYPQHQTTPPPVTDTILEKSCALEGSIMALLIVSCETFKQTMNNFKLRTNYGSIH